MAFEHLINMTAEEKLAAKIAAQENVIKSYSRLLKMVPMYSI